MKFTRIPWSVQSRRIAVGSMWPSSIDLICDCLSVHIFDSLNDAVVTWTVEEQKKGHYYTANLNVIVNRIKRAK